MKIKETSVTQTQIDDISELVLQANKYVGRNPYDVLSVITGKSGVMYQGWEDPSVGYKIFFQNFFEKIYLKEQVRNFQHILITIGVSDSVPLMMTDIGILSAFVDNLPPEINAMWDVIKNNEENSLTITVLCTNDV
ncbi:MAG: hypothetical protein KBT20_06185 [Bacteroidales bacterium]|nr:hypothetical protein [Candidatus Liminaster caballi]